MMTSHAPWIVLVAFVLLSGAVDAQLPPDIEDPLGPVEFLVGRWTGTGDGDFGKYREEMEVKKILKGRILSFGHVLQQEKGPFELRGHLTRDRYAQWKGSWCDSAGFVSLFRGRVEGEGKTRALILEEVIRSQGRHFVERWTLRLHEDGSLESIREFGDPGALRILIRAQLQRVK